MLSARPSLVSARRLTLLLRALRRLHSSKGDPESQLPLDNKLCARGSVTPKPAQRSQLVREDVESGCMWQSSLCQSRMHSPHFFIRESMLDYAEGSRC
eukprot:4620762-Pleurochrysis_carterae.AAC.1